MLCKGEDVISKRIAFLFPGQGSQYSGMLHDLPDHAVVEATLAEASSVLGQDVLMQDSGLALQSTIAVQVSLFIAGVASARALMNAGVKPNMVAGHSVGTFAAAVMADVLDFKDALRLVKRRGELMESAYPDGFGMGAVCGLKEPQLQAVVDQVSSPEAPVYIANLNAPAQMTISGDISAVHNALSAARTTGASRVSLLNVRVPSHCILLESVAAQLEQDMGKIAWLDPIVPYAANRTGRGLRRAAAVREDLAQGVANKVRWHDATSLFFELGARLFIEMPPGSVLTNLASSAFPEARIVSISDSGFQSAIDLALRT